MEVTMKALALLMATLGLAATPPALASPSTVYMDVDLTRVEEATQLNECDINALVVCYAITAADEMIVISGAIEESAQSEPAESTTRTKPTNSPIRQPISKDVEDWRPLVAVYFAPGDVDQALRIIQCESQGKPTAKNPNSSASGLFQHLASAWAERSAKAGWAGADIFDPTANIAVAAWLVYEGGGWSHWNASRWCW
jgi:hypothetical protein